MQIRLRLSRGLAGDPASGALFGMEWYTACNMRIPAWILLLACTAAAAGPQGRQVLAFYYGWYGNPQVSGHWVHWKNVDIAGHTMDEATHFPARGAYDSHDPQVIEQHVAEARRAGITGFIASWWAQGDFHDQGMLPLLNAADKAGLKVTAYYETCKPRGAPSITATADEIVHLLQQYGGHSAWLRVNGKPVIFVYGRAIGELKLAGWQGVMSVVNNRYPGGAIFIGDQISAAATNVFDGIHTYNPTGQTAHKSLDEIRAWAAQAYPDLVRTAGAKISCATVIPGYDDSRLGRPAPRPITDRYHGDTYRVLWEQAIAAHPSWVLITSWNEWHEGSEIEPSVENGDRELKTTAEFAGRFR